MALRQPLPPRYPPAGASWPTAMRVDMAAAYLDFRDTREFIKAVSCGQAPSPSAYRGKGRSREPVWSRDALDRHADPVAGVPLHSKIDLAKLV